MIAHALFTSKLIEAARCWRLARQSDRYSSPWTLDNDVCAPQSSSKGQNRRPNRMSAFTNPPSLTAESFKVDRHSSTPAQPTSRHNRFSDQIARASSVFDKKLPQRANVAKPRNIVQPHQTRLCLQNQILSQPITHTRSTQKLPRDRKSVV